LDEPPISQLSDNAVYYQTEEVGKATLTREDNSVRGLTFGSITFTG
jgi:hypothetical protein